MNKSLCALIFSATAVVPIFARDIISLSGPGWKLWRDTEAKWQSESVVVPGTPLTSVTRHLPTGGWDALEKADRKSVVVPGTVEQYFTDMSALEKDYTIDPKEFWIPLQGVSWWSRTIKVDQDLTGKRVFLRFSALRFQAEIYLNHELIACDSACDTEFTLDVTGKLKKGDTAKLDIRITNPGGDYDWTDYIPFTWNGVKLNGGRAVGGVTGHVKLEVTDPVYIDDVFVMNKPNPKEVELRITAVNTTGQDVVKPISVKMSPDNVVVAAEEQVTLKPGENTIVRKFTYDNAKLWDLDTPNLYTMNVKVGDETQDQTFGFRWFSPEGVGKDAILRLNGRRVVLRTAISWGWWPVTGTIPLPEYAEKQIKAAKTYGMNMLTFHRHMGQDLVLREADKQGLMYYIEPGGFISGSQSPQGKVIAKERVRRMVKMFRSHPSLCVYNLINELGLGREPDDREWFTEMVSFTHRNDPSRVVTLTSAWSKDGINNEDKSKMNAMPYDDTVRLVGWRDNHNAGGPNISWPTNYYRSTKDYLNNSGNKEEIVMWGEEGAISSPARLEPIVKDLDRLGQNGMDGEDYRNWLKRTEAYLDEKDLRKDFPTVDAFNQELGKVAIRHQGRRIELIRMNNITDGYAINGWEAMLRENNSGVVDTFRNPKSDPQILAQYNAPLKLAVHTATPTFTVPQKLKADVHIINEENLSGNQTLVTRLVIEGKVVAENERTVKVTGGETFGELLAEGIEFDVKDAGVGQIKAFLKGSSKKCEGNVDIVAIDINNIPKLPAGKKYAVYENGTQMRDTLNQSGFNFTGFNPASGEKPDVLLVTCAYPNPSAIRANNFSSPAGQAGSVDVTYLIDGKEIVKRSSRRLEFQYPDGTPPDPEVNVNAGFTVRIEGSYIPQGTGTYLFRLDGPTVADDQLKFTMDGKELKIADDGSVSVNLEQGRNVPFVITMTKKKAQGLRVLCFTPGRGTYADVSSVLNLAKSGTEVVLLANAVDWAPSIAAAGGLKFQGSFRLGNNWVGGQYFCKNHPVFNGFAKPAVLDFAFDSLVSNPRTGIIMEGKEELIAGAWHSLGCRLGTAIGRVPTGSGAITYSTLGIDNSYRNNPTARKLLYNLIEYVSGK